MGKDQTRGRESRKDQDKRKQKSHKTIERDREGERGGGDPKNKDIEQTEGANKLARAHIRKARTKARHP